MAAPDNLQRRAIPGLSILVGLISLVATAAAWSAPEEGTDSFTSMSLDDLMSIEVFSAASRIPTEQSRAPGTVYSFDREDFRRMGIRQVNDLFQFVPGIQMNQYRKRHRSIWSHGLLNRYNDKLILVVDGVQMQHLYYGHFSLGDNFPLEKIERVEIIQGPASSLYGANAFGGIISITTREFVEETFNEASQLELIGEVADNQRTKGTILANATKFQMFGSYLQQDAPFREERKSFIGGDTVQPLGEDYTNVFVKGSPIEGLTLALDYYENNTPFLFIPDTQDAFIEEQYANFSLRHEIGDHDGGKLETTLYYTDDRAREFEIESETRQLGYNENQDATMAGLNVTGFRRFGDHLLALGASWKHEQAEDTRYVRYFRFDTGFIDPPIEGDLLSEPGISTDDYAVFIQDVWNITPELDLTLGARYDDFEKFGGSTNYRAAMVYQPASSQTWKVMYGTGIRTPTWREYLKVLEGGFVAPVPDPERIASLELAWLQRWRDVSATVTVYRNQVDDFIREVPTPDGEDEYFANSTEMLEAMGVDTLFEFMLSQDLMMRLNVSYTDADVIGTGDKPYLATWMAGFNMNYRYADRHEAGLSLVYNDERIDTNSFPDDDPDAFVVVNLFASGGISSELEYRVGVDNLFDELVFDPAADFDDDHNTERTVREIWLQLLWKPTL